MKAIFVDKKTEELENYMLETEVIDNLDTKVDKQPPKVLSTNDFTDAYKANVEANNLKVSFPEAPIDGKEYVRKDGDWVVSSILAGQDGDSAYEIALANGFIGTEAEWLESLVGPQGLTGEKPAHQWDGTSLRFENPDGSWGSLVNLIGPEGPQGIQGPPGEDGQDGLSAYEIAVNNGFIGDESAWLASLIGPEGPQGIQGIQGEPGADGADGLSAYEVWLNLGNEGTETDFIADITGPQGPQGIQGPPGPDGQGVPVGGTTGQVLKKKTNADFDTEWGEAASALVKATGAEVITGTDDEKYVTPKAIKDGMLVSGDTLPIGTQVPFGSLTIPDNWLLCDGRAISRADYSELFAVIGTSYGAGDGTTTFNLPNKKGRTSVGYDASQTEFNAVGKTGGSKYLQKHKHTVLRGTEGNSYFGLTGKEPSATPPYSMETSEAGTGDSGNLQPYETDVWIIKAKQSAGVVATVVDTLDSTSPTNALSAKQGKILNEKIKPVLNIWTRSISGISSDTTINFPTALPNGIYNLFYVRSVGTNDNGTPVTFVIYGDNEVWIYLESVGWIQEANADSVGRRNIKISRTGIYATAGGYNKLSDGSYSENNNICIPYKIDLILKY